MPYIRNVLSSVRKADLDFSLINDGDRIAVGISGGKDSMCLLKALSIYTKYSKKNFTVHPIFLDLGFDFDRSLIKKMDDFARDCGTTLTVVDSRFVFDILKTHSKENGQLPCSICSRMKKAAINAEAKKLKCNKVAFAHHNEDALETLFMNMVHGGRVATFEPKMTLERAGVTFIRPLINCYERYLVHMAEEENIPIVSTNCPNDKHTERENMKLFLKKCYHDYPETVGTFRNLLTNYESFCLYFHQLEYVDEKKPEVSLRPMISASDMRGSKISSKKAKAGEKDWIIYNNHKKVGEISYLNLSAHKVLLFNADGKDEDIIGGIRFLIERISLHINPVHFYLYSRKALAMKLGFKETSIEGRKKAVYVLSIKK